jgi:Flp pilus assembly protein TadB
MTRDKKRYAFFATCFVFGLFVGKLMSTRTSLIVIAVALAFAFVGKLLLVVFADE